MVNVLLRGDIVGHIVTILNSFDLSTAKEKKTIICIFTTLNLQ